jgi:ribosomal protein L7/L12
MDEVSLIDVFAVYGDYGNIGDGILIGVFENENLALKAALGRGNMDCRPTSLPNGHSNDGNIVKKKAVKVNDEVYLLEVSHLVKLNTVLTVNKRVSWCVPEETTPYFKVKLIDVGINKQIEFMKFVRCKTGMSLVEVKNVYNRFREKGSAVIEPFHFNLDSEITKEEFVQWQQELELRGIAKIEAC